MSFNPGSLSNSNISVFLKLSGLGFLDKMGIVIGFTGLFK